MSFAAHTKNILGACALVLFVALPAQAASNSSSSVETYGTDVTVSQEGVLPSGVEWNHPLKAGDMVLPRRTERRRAPIRSRRALRPPAYPVGSLRAPLVPSVKQATPPLAAGAKASTAGVMLLQGMKNALQQSGQDLSIPESGIGGAEQDMVEPISILPASDAAKQATAKKASAASTKAGVFSIDALIADQKNKTETNNELSALPVASETSLSYEPGQAPKSLSLPVSVQSSLKEMPAQAKTTTAPVEAGLSQAAQEAAQAFDDEASIFGAPVSNNSIFGEECVPRVKKWTRSCQQAGYPASFGGQILGESRRECPSGKVRDVWLSNSCAKGAANPAPTTSQVAPAIQDVPRADSGATINASCGSSNGLAVSVPPTSNLCMSGQATSVTGQGPWRWNCNGQNGGVTVSCAAPLAPQAAGIHKQEDFTSEANAIPKTQDGRCGQAHNRGTHTRPLDGLCASGAASRVNGEGPWRWACSGTEGGQAMACLAPKVIKGVCGSVSREGVDGQPKRNLCAAGYASAVTGDGPWNWTCSGLYGGEATTCMAKLRVNAVCGPASMTGHSKTPTTGLCSVGKPVTVTGDGPWSWKCYGDNDGANVLCRAPVLENGTCGGDHGAQFMETPQDDLCATGKASRVTGNGPWNWSCLGKEGGASESCTAAVGKPEALQSSAQCGESAEIIVLSMPTEKLCAAGEAGVVKGQGPWEWTCSDKKGMSVTCKTLAKADGVCGAADNRKTPYAPEQELCKAGSPSAVKDDRKELLWHWKCRGFMGGKTTQCVAPMAGEIKQKIMDKRQTGRCGAANGQGFTERPKQDLCDVGKASSVRGAGPWSWTCNGKAGMSAVCEAEKFVDAACGKANGSIQKKKPQAGLCVTGTSTAVRGNGPWLWSCVGTGGGSSVSCSASSEAQTRVDGTCGVAANSVMTKAPKVNLCDTGVASKVYGEGPWTWTCSGKNGGMASTCQTSKIKPKAPPPPGPRVNGLCGYANGRTALSTPREGLCSSGTASAVSGSGPWNWSCLGENAGMTVSCTAPLTPPTPIAGVCGKSSGVSTLAPPRNGLCSAGIASAVSGKGPWTWSCSGTNGGGAVSCVAPHAGVTNRGLPSLTKQALYPQETQPSSKLVTPQLPKGALPPIKPDVLPNLKMSKKMNAQTKLVAVPQAKVNAAQAKAPSYVPNLPKDQKPLVRPKIKMPEEPELEGLKEPVLDSTGKEVQGGRLSLTHDISVVSFDHASDKLDKSAVRRLEKLARILNTYKTARITMVAYSSVDGLITPRHARRLSLQRALAMRDFLADKGVATNRVDVRPMGGNVPSGDMDRVDIKVN